MVRINNTVSKFQCVSLFFLRKTFTLDVRFQVLTAASMKLRFVFWDVFVALMMEAARTSETSVDNYFTWQYIPEDKSELYT
jgi:hypothetical protein